MKIISFRDGLGNQLFQYRLYQYLRKKYPCEKIYGYYNKKWLSAHNGLEIFDRFDLEKPKATFFSNLTMLALRIVDKLFSVISRDGSYNDRLLAFIGYWQDQNKWGRNFEPLPYKQFILNKNCKNVILEIQSKYSISLHIRRGDYLLPGNEIYNVCDLDYYKKAIKYIENRVVDCQFFIFSDDIEWAKNNLNRNNAIYVDINKGKDSFYDMYLMSLCDSCIIANSSFSYWGAINGRKKDYVIYPLKWRIKETHQIPNIFNEDWIGL